MTWEKSIFHAKKNTCWGDVNTTYYNPNGIPQSTGITSMSCFPVRTSPGLSRDLTRKWSSWADGLQVHNAHTHGGHKVNNHESYARTPRMTNYQRNFNTVAKNTSSKHFDVYKTALPPTLVAPQSPAVRCPTRNLASLWRLGIGWFQLNKTGSSPQAQQKKRLKYHHLAAIALKKNIGDFTKDQVVL